MNQHAPDRSGHKQMLTTVLLAACVVIGVFICEKVLSAYAEPAKAKTQVEAAIALNSENSALLKNSVEASKKIVETLKKQNLFVKEPPKQHPVKEVAAILGSEVLIGDKWYKEGNKVGDAKIVAIEPTQVRIEWNGQTKTFAPIAAATGGSAGSGSGPRGPQRPEPKPEGPASEDDGKAQAATVTVAETAGAEDPLAWLGANLSPRLRALLEEKWNSASEEEKQRAKEEWNKMSDAEKEKALAGMEEGIEQMERMER